MKRCAFDTILIVALTLWAVGTAIAGEPAEGGGASAESRIQGDPAAARPLFQQGQTAYTEGRYADAATLFQQAYDAWHHPAFAYNKGQAIMRVSRWQEALTAFQLYVSGYQTSGLPSSEFDPLVHIQIAECQHRLGQRDEARQALQRYIEANPQGTLTPAVRECVEAGADPSTIGARDPQTVTAARRVHDEAEALHRQGRYREAAERYRQGYTQHGDITEFLYNAASSYRAARMWAEAIVEYERYLQTPAPTAEANIELAQCYHEQAEYERAIEAYRRYLQREPTGTFAEDARQYIESMTTVLETRQGQQPSQDTMNQARQRFERGTAHYAAGRYRQALEEFSQAHDLVPARASQFNVGMCYLRMRDWVRALTQFENCLRDGDTGLAAETHLRAAECLLELMRWGDAQNHIRDYLQRADEAELPNEERDRARAEQLSQRARQISGAGGSN
ncbi:MAG: tetratricopeptide repeat protein [Verrucomicrobia bacterium]|nr:tetratricopeptide repeat protein [Verrucomicrobiota bacterium]